MSENDGLKVKGEKTKLSEAHDNQQTTVDLSAYTEPHGDAGQVRSFAIEEHERNTEQNPDHESTNMFPTLVRKINSEELLPRPFKSTSQLVCAAYCSMLCCCFCAAFATKHAWRTQERRNNGLYTIAIKEAKTTRLLIILACSFGTCLWIIGVIVLIQWTT